jgi:hypothetical protein
MKTHQGNFVRILVSKLESWFIYKEELPCYNEDNLGRIR